ncbi:MAG: hypothetical protein HYS53_01880 [Candidatus Aenigmarchaeota archaeon]|nr:hypothetical protein [Candidatus Aenigmarchaeota archaeon]
MDHVAIMKKSWGLTGKIPDGSKTIESRWYRSRRRPWGRIKKGDTVYFKNSGEPIKIKCAVRKVVQFAALTPVKVMRILNKYGKADGIENSQKKRFYRLFKRRKYCILVFLCRPEKVGPFYIKKAGFGAMSAWISTTDIGRIKKRS